MKVTSPSPTARFGLPDLALLGALLIVTVIGSSLMSLMRPLQVVFKWLAAPDYVRDIIDPYFGSERMTFAFQSFFRSDRRAALFKPLDKRREWVPFMCLATDEALKRPHDAIDIRMLHFIREHYCV